MSTIDLSNLPSADRHAVAAKICRTTTTPGAVGRIITDQLDEAKRGACIVGSRRTKRIRAIVDQLAAENAGKDPFDL